MKVVTAAEMQAIEKAAQEKFHISPLILMENAGKEAAIFINKILPDKAQNKRAAVFAGKGNNAGDGFVAARHLHNLGINVLVILLNKPEEFSEHALLNYQIINSMGLEIQTLSSEQDLHTLKIALLNTDIIVDAIYGTGFKGSPPPFVSKVFEVINSSGIPVMSLDIPSGVEADSGKIGGDAVNATWTLAMGIPKLGLILNKGSEFAGKIKVLDISLPKTLLNSQEISRNIITTELCSKLLPPRKADSHKGTYGHVLVVGGSKDMTGAAVLSAGAAARSGCGLVTLALPQSMQAVAAAQLAHVITKGLAETEQRSISKEAYPELKSLISHVQTIIIGPGMTKNPETLQFVREVVKNSPVPIVIDADAIFAFKDRPDIIKNCTSPIVLTPHPGELAAFIGKTVPEVQGARLQIAEELAGEYGITLVLKGYRTIVASSLGLSYISTSGNSGLAKGGTGDVLAGVIGGLLAQGMDAHEAAAVAVHVHGRSGDICAENMSIQGMHALDVIQYLNAAWLEIENIRGDY